MRFDHNVHRCRLFAPDAIGAERPDAETICARGQLWKVDRAARANILPGLLLAAHLIAETHLFGLAQTQARIMIFEIALSRKNFQRLAQFLRCAIQHQPLNMHKWWRGFAQAGIHHRHAAHRWKIKPPVACAPSGELMTALAFAGLHAIGFVLNHAMHAAVAPY